MGAIGGETNQTLDNHNSEVARVMKDLLLTSVLLQQWHFSGVLKKIS